MFKPPKRQKSLVELLASAKRQRTNTAPIKEVRTAVLASIDGTDLSQESEAIEDAPLDRKLESATKMYEGMQDKIEQLQEQLRERTAELEACDNFSGNDSGSKMKSFMESRKKYFNAMMEIREKEIRAGQEFLAALRKASEEQRQ